MECIGSNPLEQLFKRFSPMVFSIGISILKSREDAEDVVQDVFTHKVPALLVSNPGLNLEEMGRMLSVITKNLCIDRYRRRRRFPDTELDPDRMGSTGAESESDLAIEREKELASMMLELAPRHQEVLTLKYLWELTWEEVATRLGISNAGARKRADLAKQALTKQALTKETLA